MNPLLILAETQALKLFHDEMTAGAPADVAAQNVLARLEAKLVNPVVRAVVTAVLDAIVRAVETAAAVAPSA